MKVLKRKGRLALIALTGILITVFCIEHLSYVFNSASWPQLSKDDKNVIVTVLFVADPQIQGEEQESFLFGWITRWDSDRYLRKNFQLAKHHTSPNVIVFLGDLFDEGELANDPEYRRYFKRFRRIFDLPTNRNPQQTTYVYVPGDNDVGGEKSEPSPVKVSWFSRKFGDIRTVVDFSNSGTDIQFVKMNLFMPNEYKNPLKGFENVINGTKKPHYRFIVSHVSLLSFVTNAVQQVIENLQPNLIFSAHSHKSTYLRHQGISGKGAPHIIHDFLVPGQSYRSTSDRDAEKGLPEHQKLYTDSSLKLNIRAINKEIHEIQVPTCSYRMGVYNMGYGVMQLYRDGTMEYRVLWLPSRFKQLFLYAAIYVLVKIVVTPWILWKLCTFICGKVRDSRFVTQGYIKV